MINVLLVDDSVLIRKTIKHLIGNHIEIKIIGECVNGSLVIPFLEQNPVDVILMDYEMPGLDGIDTTRIVKKLFPEVKIIGVSFNNKQFIKNEFLASGASLFLPKDAIEPDMLINEIINCCPTY
jgi:DNA-binding NarL/FixJ family response regulator